MRKLTSRAARHLGALIAIACIPLAAQAQEARPLAPGDVVRVRYHDARWSSFGLPDRQSATMEVVSVDSWRLVGRRGSRTISVPYATMSRLQQRVGTRAPSAPEMVIGSAAGFAAGFLLGALESRLDRTTRGSKTLNDGLTSGVLVGAPIGALVAYLSSRSRGIYEDVGLARIVPSVLPSDEGGVELSFGVSGR